jgi:predicted site-specific integrase-resolvase
MDKYIKLSEYAKKRSITYRTAWTHFKMGKISGSFKDDLGNIFIPDFDTTDYTLCACYSRVYSNEMKENLIRQQDRLEEFASANGFKIVKSVREIGSGMNDSRYKLIDLLNDDSWNTLIIEHKDRLTRFGFNYIETLLNKSGKKILVINKSNEDKNDLMQDLISIIYSFSARIYGLRRKKKKEDIKNFIESC